ncbi:MAG: Na+/H+ antiporter NhaA [Micrococcaceae bacterium]
MPQKAIITMRSTAHEIWSGIHKTLKADAFGGALLLIAAISALICANSNAAFWYQKVSNFKIGPAALHLDLTISNWATDGLLAIFFFVVGLELKEEFILGRLKNPRKAAIPIAAAAGGVIVPALIFTLINLNSGTYDLCGWAIPSATDIAFAVALLAIVGKFLSPELRTFLLTLAIVDDLIAIIIIAIFYTSTIHFLWLLITLIPLGTFGFLVQRGVCTWWLLVPLAVITWALIHASGIHATIAGALLSFTVPVKPTEKAKVLVTTDEKGLPIYDGLAAHFADQLGQISVLFAVPVFAFFAAGVEIGGWTGLQTAFNSPITIGIIAGLVLGKPIGILSTTFLMSKSKQFTLDAALKWPDLVGMSFVAGIGFTVSLLVGELAYGTDNPTETYVKIGVLTGSTIAALIGSIILGLRNSKTK